jgi:hypothetical protein
MQRSSARTLSKVMAQLREPTLWRYYGLWVLLILAVFAWGIPGIIARSFELQWLREWYYDGIGALCVGVCLVIRGLDFIVLYRRYPPFLKKSAPKWETYAHRVTPAALLYQGVWATFGGLILVLGGARNLIHAVLRVSRMN